MWNGEVKKVGRLILDFSILKSIVIFSGNFGMVSLLNIFDLEFFFIEYFMGLMCRRSLLGSVDVNIVVSEKEFRY